MRMRAAAAAIRILGIERFCMAREVTEAVSRDIAGLGVGVDMGVGPGWFSST